MFCLFKAFVRIENITVITFSCFVFLFFCRYVESADTLGRETNIDLNKYEVADNVDLETVLMEYESYYYIKFNRYPKIAKKLSAGNH